MFWRLVVTLVDEEFERRHWALRLEPEWVEPVRRGSGKFWSSGVSWRRFFYSQLFMKKWLVFL